MTRRRRRSGMIREVAARPYDSQRRTVGIAELRHRIREYLRRVAAGETIWVTEGDRVVAELRPPAIPQAQLAHPWLADPRLADMVRRGVLTLPTVVEGPLPPRVPVMSLDALLADLDESRSDR